MPIRTLQPSRRETAEIIYKMQYRSYQIEADLIDFQDLPPLKETVETIQSSNETFLGYFIDDELVGVVSYKDENEEIDIYRMMVDPDHFRKGIADCLLTYLKKQYPDHTFIVHTGSKNTPAVNLYKKHGFKTVDEVEVAPNIYISQMKS
ncbi:GNAT family N-acetyltransferase [Halobacillus yeomjeoni]|uniref:GNAT family N-acetyltransferase n=1 Tax=Halobacillus yeomjeoni TaxID=311194 RepID=A0A931HYB3_9BACI|nr:GNAT family N-acetyltransferase [Halobacillus yeomjeoni]MBH0231653.1 GNAT family N-acetyltransferase [Halobacillus yeomjeoni]